MIRWLKKRMPFLLFGVAFLPRLAAIGRYVTPDELIWVYRSIQFREALLAGQWGETLVAGHPGVVTTWCGALGISVQLLFSAAARESYAWLTHIAYLTPDNTAAFVELYTFLTAGRLMVIGVNCLGLVGVYGLLQRLWGWETAVFVSLLLAFDPFVVGLSGLLHVDALMSTFAVLSLLSLAVAVRGMGHGFTRMNTDGKMEVSQGVVFALFSGAMAGLAGITKSPGLLLGPVAALVFGIRLILQSAKWRSTVKQGVGWLAGFGGTAVLLFPALWSSPLAVFTRASSNANRHLEEALRPTFFLGHVTYDHGPLFYPITVAFRLSPVVWIGLLVMSYWVLKWVGRQIRKDASGQMGKWGQELLVSMLTPEAILGVWMGLFLILMTFAAKKFDRYALPVIFPMTVVTAVVWSRWAGGQVGKWASRLQPKVAITPSPATTGYNHPLTRKTAVLLTIHLLYWLSVWSYPLMGFNWLLGGPWAAQKVMTIGWGEGISVAGQWLTEQPGTNEETAVAGVLPALAPFFTGQALYGDDETALSQANYVIVTANGRQLNTQGIEIETADLQLLHTIHYAGLDQAWIYANPAAQKPDREIPLFSQPLSFDNRVQLWGAKITAENHQIHFFARWGLLQPAHYNLKLTIADWVGHEWGHLDTELLNEVYFYPEFWGAAEKPLVRYTVDLPAGLPPDVYTVDLSLFEAESGAQLPLLTADGTFRGVVYSHQITIPPAAVPPNLSELGIPIPLTASWLNGDLILLGQSALPVSLVSGEKGVLDLFWQATAKLPANLQLAIRLGDGESAILPLSRYNTAEWQPGTVIQEKYTLVIPSETPAGLYPLQLLALLPDGTPLSASAVSLGQLEVVTTDRLFTLPDNIPTRLDEQFGVEIDLKGLQGLETAVSPGSTVPITLYWQMETQPANLYSVFFQVLNPDGSLFTQADHWPGGLPTNTLVAGQVVIDEFQLNIPAGAPPGQYQIIVGLYNPANGVRLLVTSGNDYMTLPIPLIVANK